MRIREWNTLIKIIFLVCCMCLSACAEPVMPEVKIEEEDIVSENEAVDGVVYTETEVVKTNEGRELYLQPVYELAEIGTELTYGDIVEYSKSLKNDEDTPENANRYVFTKGGARYQLVVMWEEGIEPQNDTPLISAVLSLISDSTICVDIMFENPAIVFSADTTPKK